MERKVIGVLPIVTGITGLLIGGHVAANRQKVINNLREQKCKIEGYYRILNRWLALRQKEMTVLEYFRKNGLKKIAIYGMKELGERLYDELKETDVQVVCIIDQAAESIDCEVPIVTPDSTIPMCDAIIVTASYYFQSIESALQKKASCPIISIDEVIYEINK